ncbi:unnamed protein product, partial [Schistosoma turkestanicum]
MELLVLSNPNISTIITWAFGVASGANHESICNNTTSCILNSNVWTEPRGISGLVLIVIALILAFAVILIKELHTKSTRNAIIMFITLIIMIIGVISVTLCFKLYEQLIATIVPLLIMTFMIATCLETKGSAAKWRILLFFICCVLVIFGIFFSILSINRMCRDSYSIAFPILSAICWYEAMLIVIALTLFYLMKKIEQEDYSVVYMTFI